MKPQRIQLSRKKGWRMPPGAVKVDRTTVFGNPFTFASLEEAGMSQGDKAKDAAFLVESFRDWLVGGSRYWQGPACDATRNSLRARLPELRGKDLACWCKLCDRHKDGRPLGEQCSDCSPCHADVELELANK